MALKRFQHQPVQNETTKQQHMLVHTQAGNSAFVDIFTLLNTRKTDKTWRHILRCGPKVQYTALLTMGVVSATGLETFNPQRSVQKLHFCH